MCRVMRVFGRTGAAAALERELQGLIHNRLRDIYAADVTELYGKVESVAVQAPGSDGG